MGFNDRDYYRDERPGFSFRAPRTVVGWLILINLAIWIIDGLFMPQSHWLLKLMSVHVNAILAYGNDNAPTLVEVDTLTQPWFWWQFLTYAFAHSPNFAHVATNMLALFFLGRDVEMAYGRREFLRIYLVTAIFASVVWAAANKFIGTQNATVIGASGAIAGVVILYALNFPKRTLLLYLVIPIPAWFLGVLAVVFDMYGAIASQDNVAYAVHLAGAGFAFIYYRQQWNLTRMTSSIPQWFRSWTQPKLKIHRPREEKYQTLHTSNPVEDSNLLDEFDDLNSEVDRILEKIYREGESSLTTKERRTLETASREFQRRGRIGGGKHTS